MAYFPMFVDMTERECLIVGGGNVAYRKVIVMLDFGAVNAANLDGGGSRLWQRIYVMS